MKGLTSVLLLHIAAFIIGCNESGNITSPTGNGATSERVAKPIGARQIPLDLILRLPGEFNSLIQVTGSVEYTITILPRDPIPPNPQFSLLIDLILDAEVRPYGLPGPPAWYVGTSTRDDVLPTGEDGRTGYLTKRYFISGLNRWLHLSFTLTETDVELSRSWLELPKVVPERDEH